MIQQRFSSTGSVSSNGSSIRSTKSNNNTKKKTTRPPVFAKRLYDMLENAERDGYDHIISWMPDGKSFKIHVDGRNNSEIVDVLKKNFNQTRFKSFLRQLQIYGIERTYNGVRSGECKHELLVRGQRNLLDEKTVKHFSNPRTVEVVTTSSSSSASTPTPQSPTAPVSCSSQFGSPYRRTTNIPCRLNNLVLPESYRSVGSISSDSSISDNDSDSYSECDTVSQSDSSSYAPSWQEIELKMLRLA